MPSRPQTLIDLPIEKIVRGKQPRTNFPQASIDSLAATLLQRGFLYPLRVRAEEDHFLLLGGERRWRAAEQLAAKGVSEFQTVPCLLVEGELSQADDFEEKLIDNLHREDLDPIDEANGYAEYAELRGNLDSREVARRLQLKHQRVKDVLSLLGLPDDVQALVRAGILPRASAYEIAKLADAEQQREVARTSIDEGLSARTVKAVVARQRGKPKRKPSKTRRTVFDVGRGAKVVVRSRQNLEGTGVLEAVQRAARAAHADLMSEEGGSEAASVTISWATLGELVAAFNDPVFEFALLGLTRKTFAMLAIGLTQLLDHEEESVRNTARDVLNKLSLPTKQALAPFQHKK